MNQKLLQTKLTSIANYRKQIEDLKEAQKVTLSTVDEIILSLSEFCDLIENDIIVQNGFIYRFKSIEGVGKESLNMGLNVQVQTISAGYSREVSWENKTIWIPILEMQNVKVIGNTNNDSFKTAKP